MPTLSLIEARIARLEAFLAQPTTNRLLAMQRSYKESLLRHLRHEATRLTEADRPFLPEPSESPNPYSHTGPGQCLACRWNAEFVESGTMDDCQRCDHVHQDGERCPEPGQARGGAQ
jgi:hypothetical protein